MTMIKTVSMTGNTICINVDMITSIVYAPEIDETWIFTTTSNVAIRLAGEKLSKITNALRKVSNLAAVDIS